MAIHSGILIWKIPWTEEPGRLQSMRQQRVGHNRTTNTFFYNTPPPGCTHEGVARQLQKLWMRKRMRGKVSVHVKQPQITFQMLASIVVYGPDTSVSCHLRRRFCFCLYNYPSFTCSFRSRGRNYACVCRLLCASLYLYRKMDGSPLCLPFWSSSDPLCGHTRASCGHLGR